jgi:hypothetical protein
MKVLGFCCEEYGVFLKNVVQLLNHLDGAYGVHIWYKREMTRQNMFFYGNVEENLANEIGKKDMWTSVSRNKVPLSKRPC